MDNKQIEELVEWAAKTLYEKIKGVEWGHSGTMDDESWRRVERKYLYYTKQILTNPKYPLGIIVGMEDREVAPKTFTVSYPKGSKPAMVIPLSKYLEVAND